MMVTRSTYFFLLISFAFGCGQNTGKKNLVKDFPEGSYGYDLSFLKQHTGDVIELSSADGKSRIALSARYQGRVFTSTSNGDSGRSFGWLNYKLLAAPAEKRQFNAVGGEERFWLGPEGGQYSIYFRQHDSFLFKNWQVPPLIDTEPFNLDQSDSSSATFSKTAHLQNYSGTAFDFEIHRRIVLREIEWIEKIFNSKFPPGLEATGYSSENSITNTGKTEWKPDGGLLSIWLLGMFTPSPETFVVIPFHKGAESRKRITDNYFGKIPPDRLQVNDSIIFFKCDGKYRSKIGIHPSIAKTLALAFDFKNNVLTIVVPEIYNSKPYVNSKWEIQSDPFEGDAVNAYNDGPLEDGSMLGPFFEIESSSPALILKPAESFSYTQTTFHLTGTYSEMQGIVQALTGTSLDQLKSMIQK
jgi:hypothetical protein